MTTVPKPPPDPKKPQPAAREKRHVSDLLDDALDKTFPASDPPAMLQPAPDEPSDDDQIQ